MHSNDGQVCEYYYSYIIIHIRERKIERKMVESKDHQ